MKIFLVTFFLIIAFLSQSMGKHFLIKTDDDDDDASNGRDYAGLDMSTVDAKTLINTVFTDDELDAFENLPKEKQTEIVKDIDKIIDNVRN